MLWLATDGLVLWLAVVGLVMWLAADGLVLELADGQSQRLIQTHYLN